MPNVQLAPPADAISALGLREVIHFAVNVAVTANATQALAGSLTHAVGTIPKRRLRLVHLSMSGQCAAAANTPELNICVFKNLVPTGLPTPNLTNRAMRAKALLVVSTGAYCYSDEPLDPGMQEFNGTTDFWTVGTWCTGATGTCSMTSPQARLEFLIL